MTTAQFEKIVSDWLATARDARFKRPLQASRNESGETVRLLRTYPELRLV